MKTRIGMLTMAWVLVVLASNAPAAVRDWNNLTGTNNWFTAGNWIPVGAPAPADSLIVGGYAQKTPIANAVVISNGGGITVFDPQGKRTLSPLQSKDLR